MARAGIVLWLLAVAVAANGQDVRSGDLREIIPSVPAGEAFSEASAILPIQSRTCVPEEWTNAFWTLLDEPPVEQALARLGCRRDGTWELQRVAAENPGGLANATGDCEAIARRGSMIYIFGSHFGKKKGKLDPARQFVARFDEARCSTTEPIRMEVALDGFLVHRMVNDALLSSGLVLIARGTGERDRYILRTLRSGDAGAGGRVREGDRAINIEGVAFAPDGMLLLGLRYPVTIQGHPVVVGLKDIDRLFQGASPSVAGVWVLDGVGDAETPAGIRDMMERDGRIEVLTGNLERSSGATEESTLLEDHPEAIRASSRHYRFAVPVAGKAAVGNLAAELVRDLAPASNAEGLAVDAHGRMVYAFDEKRVRLCYEADPSR